MRYLIVIESMETGFSAYSPDVPGCFATGASREETERTMSEALALHVDALREVGLEIPEPQSSSAYVDVPL